MTPEDQPKILDYTSSRDAIIRSIVVEREANRLVLTGRKFNFSPKYWISILLVNAFLTFLIVNAVSELRYFQTHRNSVGANRITGQYIKTSMLCVGFIGMLIWGRAMYRRRGSFTRVLIDQQTLTSCNPERLNIIRKWAIRKRWKIVVRSRGLSLTQGYIANLCLRSIWGEAILFQDISKTEAQNLKEEITEFVDSIRHSARGR